MPIRRFVSYISSARCPRLSLIFEDFWLVVLVVVNLSFYFVCVCVCMHVPPAAAAAATAAAAAAALWGVSREGGGWTDREGVHSFYQFLEFDGRRRRSLFNVQNKSPLFPRSFCVRPFNFPLSHSSLAFL